MEIWKKVVGFIGYEVSNMGNVRSINRSYKSIYGSDIKLNGTTITGYVDKGGYHKVVLSKKTIEGSVRKGIPAHRVVAIAFIPNPENKPQVNHINGIKSDNRVVNLEWATAKENRIHAGLTGLNCGPKSENAWGVKLNKEIVLEIRRLRETTRPSVLAKMYNIAPSTVTMIIKRQSWKDI